jgi:hypothetical protein
MPRVLPADDIRAQLEQAHDRAEESESVTLVKGSSNFNQGVNLEGYPLPDVVQLCSDIGANLIYSSFSTADDGETEWARLSFIHDGVHHVQDVESAALAEARQTETEEQADEIERKQSLAEEMLECYVEEMDDAQEYRLRNNVEDIPMERLLQLQERLQEQKERREREEQIDEDLEQQLAEEVYNTDRFSRQFNERDTEVLLRQLDIDFDEDAVRIEEVHRWAKSLLKVNR